jgi:hypothetical protein
MNFITRYERGGGITLFFKEDVLDIKVTLSKNEAKRFLSEVAETLKPLKNKKPLNINLFEARPRDKRL